MTRLAYFIRVNGLAASRDRSYNYTLKAAKQAQKARPDAVISLVKVNCDTGKEVEELRLYPESK